MNNIRTKFIPEATCPSCGKEVAGITGRLREGELPGRASVCSLCGEILQIGPDLKPMVMPADVVAELPFTLLQSLKAMQKMVAIINAEPALMRPYLWNRVWDRLDEDRRGKETA